MTWVYDDGGRAAAGFKGSTGDCVTRAIAIATGRPYREVYDDLFALGRARVAIGAARGRKTRHPSPRTGVARAVFHPYLLRHGWRWEPTMSIGSGTTVHLRADELPEGRVIARCSRHLVAVIDGVIHDTADPTRDGTRAVYGYYWKEP